MDVSDQWGPENGVDNPWRDSNEGLVAIFQWLSNKPIISRFLARLLRLSLGTLLVSSWHRAGRGIQRSASLKYHV